MGKKDDGDDDDDIVINCDGDGAVIPVQIRDPVGDQRKELASRRPGRRRQSWSSSSGDNRLCLCVLCVLCVLMISANSVLYVATSACIVSIGVMAAVPPSSWLTMCYGPSAVRYS